MFYVYGFGNTMPGSQNPLPEGVISHKDSSPSRKASH